MIDIICVGTGGGIGAILRYLTSKYVSNITAISIPLGTLIVNVVGGFLIGLIIQLSLSTTYIPQHLKTFLTTGMLGGFTTFATFSYETVSLLQDGKYLLGLGNIVVVKCFCNTLT